MPLVNHNNLPAFARIASEGHDVLAREVAQKQDIRALHIGLLNMMPDAALAATERQFFRLVGGSNLIAQFHLHPFTLDGLERGEKAQQHIGQYYERFDQIQAQGLDALIITGANPQHDVLSEEPFWPGLMEVVDWAKESVTSVLCSCLASHAIMQRLYGLERKPLGYKRWGVFPHQIVAPEHPLLAHLNQIFDTPHSRFNEIYAQDCLDAGLHVLAHSPSAGLHLATSPDGFRFVFFQGHPEYDAVSLFKEYAREVNRYQIGERPDYPPFPEQYFVPHAQAILREYQWRLENAWPESGLPTALIEPLLINSWRDTARGLVNNWLGRVYQITHLDRDKPFMDGVDPDDPLGYLSRCGIS